MSGIRESKTAETGAGASDVTAMVALVLGALAIGASPILVRWAEVGPFAAAFWRVALALPPLLVWALWEEQARFGRVRLLPVMAPRTLGVLVLAGLLFAGDLTFWHLSILNTSVANATLLANFSPVIVTLGAWWLLGEHIGPRFLMGLGAAMLGAVLLMGASFQMDPENLSGDLYGLITACFFGSYVLAVRLLRGSMGAAALMFWSGVVTAATLLVVSLVMGDAFWPQSTEGWLVLLALAWVSHAGGQGMLAYALGHLPASFSSLVILLEPIAAALLGWALLAEAVTWGQALGGAVVLAGVMLARRASREPRP